MKYKGRKLEGPRIIVVPILRPPEEGGDIFIKVQGVVDLQPFFDICPFPKAPQLKLPGGGTRDDIEDTGYKDECSRWWKTRSDWIIIKSLSVTEGLEWENVDLKNPESYRNWEEEFRNAGFVDAEVARVLGAMAEVNGLSEKLVEEARKSFLATAADQANGQNSQMAAATNTQSGAPAKKLESVPQDSKT